MLRNFFSIPGNENGPLPSPILWGLQKWGVLQPKDGSNVQISMVIHFAAIIYLISQYVELWIIRSDLTMALRNLSYTILSTTCIVKSITYITWQKHWRNIIEDVLNMEARQLSKEDEITNSIINDYKKYSRRVTYFYCTLVSVTVITVIVAPLVGFLSSAETRDLIRNFHEPYPQIMSSWVPFDKTRGLGYWFTVLEHIWICVYAGSVVATYDSIAVVLMSFLAGQMKLLSVNCSRLFEDEERSYDDEIKKIKDCHHHHVLLIKYSKILNSLLSPVMFLYVIICSLMICASAIQVTTEGTTTVQRIWIAEFLVALIAQLFLYCWHSNEVLVMSHKVSDGVYASAWWSRSIRVRRCVLLLGAQLSRRVVFTAGPFTTLTLPTFIAILKGSYSYYTLLNNKNNTN